MKAQKRDKRYNYTCENNDRKVVERSSNMTEVEQQKKYLAN